MFGENFIWVWGDSLFKFSISFSFVFALECFDKCLSHAGQQQVGEGTRGYPERRKQLRQSQNDAQIHEQNLNLKKNMRLTNQLVDFVIWVFEKPDNDLSTYVVSKDLKYICSWLLFYVLLESQKFLNWFCWRWKLSPGLRQNQTTIPFMEHTCHIQIFCSLNFVFPIILPSIVL